MKLTNASGAGISGVTVTFAGTNGSSVTPAAPSTDVSGVATTALTLGPSPGPVTVTATLTSAAGSPVTFQATATASNVWLKRKDNDPSQTVVAAQGWGAPMAWVGTRAFLFQLDGSLDSYDPATNAWTEVIAAGTAGSPPGRSFASFATMGTKLYLFGGLPSGFSNDLWCYDTVGGTWTQLIADGAPGSPSARCFYSIVSDGTKLILFGGQESGHGLNDLWWYDPLGNAWTQKIADGVAGSPAAGRGVQMVWDGTRVVAFGGAEPGGAVRNDVSWYDVSTNSWTQKIAHGTPGSPAPRQLGNAVWTGQALVLFGGINSSANWFNDLWSYDPGTNTWTQKIAQNTAGSPPARELEGLVWDGTRVIMFAGGTSSFFNDLWWYYP